jgi:ADP-ribosylation factor-binding protein GGA
MVGTKHVNLSFRTQIYGPEAPDISRKHRDNYFPSSGLDTKSTMLSNAWIGSSPVEVYVQRACDPSLPEPNYALNYELAEYITKKKANTPRDAAMAIVHLVNHRNPRVSILALALLDTLVKTCGYPFHLQISTKEFLNELVRRFPERPPPFPGPVMSRILGLIHEWKEGICKESRWKEDLGNIRDMHRLLSFKGTCHFALLRATGLK